MRKEFEIILRGETEPTSVSLEQRGDIWVYEGGSVSCVALDPRTALIGALGLVQGREIWESEIAREGGEEL